MTSRNGSVVTAIKVKAKPRYRPTAILFHIIKYGSKAAYYKDLLLARFTDYVFWIIARPLP
jgi:hypothetical protein